MKYLKTWMERIWILENNGESVNVMIPPNQYINIIFLLDNSSYLHNNYLIQTPQIEGITLQTTCLKYPSGSKIIGVRFYPYGVASFMNVSGKKLLNNTIRLSQVIEQSAKPAGKPRNTTHIFLAKNKNKKILVSSKNVAIFAPQIKETNLLCIYL